MDKILLVDDEPSVLEGLQRQFRNHFQIKIASGGEEGLEVLTAQSPFSVVIADYQMPKMNGIKFLSRVRSVCPDTVRIMLTGNKDLDIAMEAVNQGGIFRFLTKPCPSESFKNAIESGIRQFQLLRAEKELLEQTLTGSLKALAAALSIFNPEAFGRASRLKRYALRLAQHLELPDLWKLDIAATLSQIGCIALPDALLQKLHAGKPLTSDETHAFEQHPNVGREILANIPRMEEVADIIKYQSKHYDGAGTPLDGRRGEDLPIGSRLLKVALDFDGFRMQEIPAAEAFAQMELRTGWYDPRIIQALKAVFVHAKTFRILHIPLGKLQPGMVLAEKILDTRGHLLVGKGQDLSEWMVARLKQMGEVSTVQEPIRIVVSENHNEEVWSK